MISYDFLGMPAPSLGMIMKMCVSMETWLVDHDQNVVAIHCLVCFLFSILFDCFLFYSIVFSCVDTVDRQGAYTHRVCLSACLDGMD